MGLRTKTRTKPVSDCTALKPEVLHLENFTPLSATEFRELELATPMLASKLLMLGLVKPPMEPTFTEPTDNS